MYDTIIPLPNKYLMAQKLYVSPLSNFTSPLSVFPTEMPTDI